ncbi:unnamed protein product [Dovyalis caffra]|uniref:Uncharacterized protein n=1 Tax=Dovyalis caffra TaxID=77055 RepID=A0AAV1RI18_9ROSI|nr:unnamed protein product [Dovyalis caffra]
MIRRPLRNHYETLNPHPTIPNSSIYRNHQHPPIAAAASPSLLTPFHRQMQKHLLKKNQERIEAIAKKKEGGNALFKAGKYERALRRYKKATNFIEYDLSFIDKEKKQSKELKFLQA